MRALDVATKFENLRAKQWPAFQVGFLSPLRVKNSSNNENTLKSTALTQLNILLERSNAEMKKQTWLNLGNDDSISSKVIRTQTEQFLELFSRTLNFFAP